MINAKDKLTKFFCNKFRVAVLGNDDNAKYYFSALILLLQGQLELEN